MLNATEDENEDQQASNMAADSVNSFSLLWHRGFTHPVYQIMCDDFVHDGTVVAIVSTLYGIHLLRSDFENAASKAQRRLALLSDIIKLERQLYRHEKTLTKPTGTLSPVSPEQPHEAQNVAV